MRPWLILVAAANPAAVAVSLWPRELPRTIVAAAAIAAVVVVAGASISGQLLDTLDVSPPTFQIAAAIVVGIAGARVLMAGAASVGGARPLAGWGRVLEPLLFPLLVTPQLVTATISVGATDGVGPAAAGAITALALAALAAVFAKRRAAVWDAAMRFLGAVAIVVAVALAVDGVKSI